jgi:uncharacterized membrane protein YkoI
MNMKVLIFSGLALLGSMGLLWAGFSGADSDRAESHEQVRDLQQQGDILSLEQILVEARKHRTGRVLETELERAGSRYIYEIELVDDSGQVWELKLDASSGELLKSELED